MNNENDFLSDAEQFEYLGRYVQAFELVLESVRFNIVFIISGSGDQSVANIILNQKYMTAEPLKDLYDELMLKVVNKISDSEEKDLSLQILRDIKTKLKKSAEMRNSVLHSTFHIGWHSPENINYSELPIRPNKKTEIKIPKIKKEIEDMIKQLDLLSKDIHRFMCHVILNTGKVSDSFEVVSDNIRRKYTP